MIGTAKPVVTTAVRHLETAYWYEVTGAEALNDPAGNPFNPTVAKVWHRPVLGLVTIIYGRRVDGGAPACLVLKPATGDSSPAWLTELLHRHGAARNQAHGIVAALIQHELDEDPQTWSTNPAQQTAILAAMEEIIQGHERAAEGPQAALVGGRRG